MKVSMSNNCMTWYNVLSDGMQWEVHVPHHMYSILDSNVWPEFSHEEYNVANPECGIYYKTVGQDY